MPSPSNTTLKQTKSKTEKATSKEKKKPTPKRDLDSLRKTATEKKKEHGRAANTTRGYAGYIRRGREFATAFAREKGEAEEDWKAGTEAGSCEERIEEESERVTGPDNDSQESEFCRSFDGAPLKCTPMGIAMFMTTKCFEEGLGKGTATSIHAAFKRHYETM